MRSHWIVGCGDLGCRLARRLIAADEPVLGTVRSAPSELALGRLGIPAHRLDLDPPMAPDALPRAAPAVLYYFAPPPDDGDTDPRLRRLLAVLQTPPRRLIYLSTSAVYGDCGGAWIDEDAPLRPRSARGRRHLDAEQVARAYAEAHDVGLSILRVPGIYGPGRLPVARLASGAPIAAPEEAPYSNRIHVEDLVTAALQIVADGAPGAAYHVSDGAPTTMSDYLRRAAQSLGLPPPPTLPLATLKAQASPMLRAFLDESKRLRNERLRGLGWQPRYPSLAEGLPSCGADDPVVAAFRSPA